MPIEFHGGRSCQFFYFNYSKTKKDLNDELTRIANKKNNNRIVINYNGNNKDDYLKGVIVFEHHSGTYRFEFTFNFKNNLLLIVGDSAIRKQAVLEFVKLFFMDDSLNTPFARMTAIDSRNVCNKLIQVNNNRILNPKFNFHPYRYNFYGKLLSKISYILDHGICAINDDREDFESMYQFCVKKEGSFTFVALVFGYDGIVDIDEEYEEKLTVGKQYSFSISSRLSLDNWSIFANSILERPLFPY